MRMTTSRAALESSTTRTVLDIREILCPPRMLRPNRAIGAEAGGLQVSPISHTILHCHRFGWLCRVPPRKYDFPVCRRADRRRRCQRRRGPCCCWAVHRVEFADGTERRPPDLELE